MKKIVLFMLIAFPMLLNAQRGCNFFEFRNVEIEKTNLNTSQSDFGPAFVNNELWFSAFTDDQIRRLAKGKSKDIFYNLYSVKTDEKGNATGTKNVQFEAIGAGNHAGPVSYCAVTCELFATLSNFDNPEIKNNVYQKADISLKIIIAKKINGVWTVTEEFPYNNPSYSVGHPAISVTGDTLFYASNKPDSGFGESDIYMSVRKSGSWGEPVNMGENVNSEFDEMFPFFFDGSVLFYATNNGEKESSNLDMKYICKTGDGFGESKTLDKFNTEEDDFGLIIHPKGKVGYFVSRKPGGMGDDDIYKVTFKSEHKLELIVMDKKSLQPFPNPKVKFSDNLPGILSGFLVTRWLPENSTLLVTSEIEGYQNSSKNISSVGKPFGILKDTIWVEKVEFKGEHKLELVVKDKKTLQNIPNPKVKFSDNVLGTLAGALLTRMLTENSTITVNTEIEGYQNSSKSITTVGKAYGIIKDTLWIEKVEVGQKFVLENIFYDYDKWDILPASEVELNKLIKVMIDNPSWKVELGSHTDARGSDSYNETLSQKRSDSAVNYIIQNGIAKERIIAKGYGETQLVNHCKNGVECTDEVHRQNRRTEFKILEMDGK